MVWDWIIATYLFLAGLGAGAFVLGALVGWKREGASKMKLAAFIIALVAVCVGTLLLVVDAKAGLMNPLRFFGLLANMSSIMMWGVVLLSAFIVVCFIEIILAWRTGKTPKALDVVGMLLALGVASYTGMLLGDASLAFPLWNPVVLPVLFVVSAASSGFAAVVLVAHLMHAPEIEDSRFLRMTNLAFPIIEAALIGVLLLVVSSTAGSAGPAAAASVAGLVGGAWAPLFWGGLVIVGLVLPLCMEIFAASKAKSAEKESPAWASYVGECGVLVGGFMLRYLVIMAALPTALMM